MFATPIHRQIYRINGFKPKLGDIPTTDCPFHIRKKQFMPQKLSRIGSFLESGVRGCHDRGKHGVDNRDSVCMEKRLVFFPYKGNQRINMLQTLNR